MNASNKALKYLYSLEMAIAGLALVVMICVTFIGVVMRYVFDNPFVWQEEVQLWCFVWVIFLGGGAAFRSGSHVAIEFLVDLMPSKIRKIFEGIIYIVVMWVLVYFTIHSSGLVRQIINMRTTTNVLHVPYSIIYSAFPIGCILMMINYTVVTAKLLFSKNIEIESGE